VLGSLLCVFGQQIPLDLSLTCKNQQAKLAGNAAKHTKLVKKNFCFYTEIFSIHKSEDENLFLTFQRMLKAEIVMEMNAASKWIRKRQ
jgi:hypothetical protein